MHICAQYIFQNIHNALTLHSVNMKINFAGLENKIAIVLYY